jgi:Right handed beta helix region
MSLTKVTYSMISGASVNALDYGVSASNTAAQNDAAFALAVASAQNKTLYIPAGVYSISATILITYTSSTNRSTNIIGEGLGTQLKWMGGDGVPVINYRVSGIDQNLPLTVVEKIYITNGNSATNLTGIRIGDINHIGTGGACNFTVRNNRIDSCWTGIQIYYESDQVSIHDNHIYSYTATGIQNSGSTACRIENNHCQNGATGTWSVYSNKGNTIVMGNVLQSDNAGAIWLENADDFTVLNNYSECGLDATGTNFLKLTNCISGFVANNNIGGYRGVNIYTLDATCNGVTFGPNRHAQSGGYPISLINVTSGATNICLSGEQISDATFTGGKFVGSITAGWQSGVDYGTLFSSNLAGNKYDSWLGALSIQTIAAGEAYLISASMSNTSYFNIVSVVQLNDFGGSAVVTNIASSSAQFYLQVSGSNIQLVNNTGVTETMRYNIIRIK